MRIGQLVKVKFGKPICGDFYIWDPSKLYIIKRKIGSKNTSIQYYLYPYDKDMEKYFSHGPIPLREFYFVPVSMRLTQTI